jgi:hypothetical protein
VCSDWEEGNSQQERLSPDIAWAAAVVERAACDSCLASDTTAVVACVDERRDVSEAADSLQRCKSVDCNLSTDIRKGCECCWLEALLRCRGRCLTPEFMGEKCEIEI